MTEVPLGSPAKSARNAKTKRRKAARPQSVQKASAAEAAREISLQELAQDFSKRRVKDQRKLTPLQRRMMSGGG